MKITHKRKSLRLESDLSRPSGRSLSRILWYEATRSISTPPPPPPPNMDGMPVHHRVTSSIKFAGTHLYTWAEKGTVRVECIVQEHNAMTFTRARTRTLSGKWKLHTKPFLKVGFVIIGRSGKDSTKAIRRKILLSGDSTGISVLSRPTPPH